MIAITIMISRNELIVDKKDIEVEKGKLVTVSICKWHNSEVIMLFPLWWPNDCVSLWTRCYDTGTAKKLINKSIYSGW